MRTFSGCQYTIPQVCDIMIGIITSFFSEMAIKRVTFRLYPNKSQNEEMHYWRRLHRDLYNACITHRREEYKRYGKSVTYLEQQNCLPEFKKVWTEYKKLGSHALQATVKRVDYAFHFLN